MAKKVKTKTKRKTVRRADRKYCKARKRYLEVAKQLSPAPHFPVFRAITKREIVRAYYSRHLRGLSRNCAFDSYGQLRNYAPLLATILEQLGFDPSFEPL